jgi:hypothetical protein
MSVFVTVCSIFMAFYLTDKACLWFEKKGWLYYRNRKPQPGCIGNALLELHAFLNPSARHVIEIKKNTLKHSRQKTDIPCEFN